MTERPRTRAEIANLVRDAVQFRGLDDDARDVARLVGVQFRERLHQAQSAAGAAADAARPAVSRAAALTGDRAGRVRERAPVVASDAARRGSVVAGEAALRGSVAAGEAARRGSVAADAARRGSLIALAAGAEAVRRADPMVRDTAADLRHSAASFDWSRSARAAAVGGIAGGLAAVAMGGVMLAAKQAGLMSETPPKEITEKSAKKAARKAAGTSKRKRSDHDRNGTRDDANDDVREAAKNASEAVHEAPQPAFDLAATAAHVGFGAALGAAFGIAYAQLPAAWRTPAATLGESLAFATGVWAVSYAGWIPALELMPPPSRDEPGRQPTIVAAHWLFGAILGAGLVAGANG